MRRALLIVLFTLSILLTGCVTKQPQRPMSFGGAAPATPIFYDPFNSGVATPWTFYQGSHLFTGGILRLNSSSNSGAYAYIRTNWTNISVSADIKLSAGSWGGAVGLRYNPTNGSSYQAWIYGSGRFSIEKYSNWFTTHKEVIGVAIPPPGTNINNITLAATNNVLMAYLNNKLLLTYVDTSLPLNGGGIELSIWGSNGVCSAEFNNVTVYDLSTSSFELPPTLITGLANGIGIQGQPKVLNINVEGSELIYLWKTPNGNVTLGTNTYVISNFQDAGTYSVTITNIAGSITSTAYLAMGTTNILTDCMPIPPKTNVTLAWCPSPSSDLIYYKIHYGSGNVVNWRPDIYDTNQPLCPGVVLLHGTNWFRVYTNSISVGTNLTATVSNLVSGATYYFSATVLDTFGLESDFSNEVEYVVPLPSPPAPLVDVSLITMDLRDGRVQLQTKVCPSTVITIFYQEDRGQPWNVLAGNIAADMYGNISYIDTINNNSMRFYRALPQ